MDRHSHNDVLFKVFSLILADSLDLWERLSSREEAALLQF